MNPFDIPDEDEVEASGTADWVNGAVQHHKKKQQSLASAFGNESRELRQEKAQLADIFGSKPQQSVWTDSSDPAHNVFGVERKHNKVKQQSLSQVFEQAVDDSQAEKNQLRDIFSKNSTKKNKPR